MRFGCNLVHWSDPKAGSDKTPKNSWVLPWKGGGTGVASVNGAEKIEKQKV
jgi:hypothetical protein